MLVVDTLGRPEPATISLVSSSNPQIGQAALEAAATTHFSPAIKNGSKVRQVVQYSMGIEINPIVCNR